MKKIILSIVIALASIVTASATIVEVTTSCGVVVVFRCDNCSNAEIIARAELADAILCAPEEQ